MTARFAQNNSLFSKNDGSFYTKQRLVFKKTTARFTQNNGLFSKNDGSLYTKQRLVFKKRRLTLHKTTACFQKKYGSRRKPNKIIGKSNNQTLRAEREGFEIVKILQSMHLARTRTRAVQRVLSFCCHKCHRPTHKTLIYKQLNKKSCRFFNNSLVPISKFLAN